MQACVAVTNGGACLHDAMKNDPMTNSTDPDDLDVTDELIAERRSGEVGETPVDMRGWMRKVIRFIDVTNLQVGRVTCLLLIPVVVAMVYEVVARKLFLAPTLWAYEVSRMFAGALFMLGAGYALMRGVHIRADFLYRNWSRRTQATVDALLYLAFYFPAMLFFFWISAEYTLKAWIIWERSMDTTMMAPLAPARTAMPLGAFFLILQGISEILKCFHAMGRRREQRFLLFVPFYCLILAAIFVEIFYPGVLPLGGIGSLLSSVYEATGASGLAPEWIGVAMIAVMLFAIFVGFPISFTLVFLGFAFGSWGFSTKLVFYLQTLQFNSVMLEQTLAAVPLFVFMGILMEQAGLMERLFTAVQLMLSRTRGALYLAVLFVSTIFAAATGIVGASVTILGIMAAKTMNRSKYDVRLSAGTITAGGTLGILIPPSIMLVVMGPVLEVPVTDLFAAAIVPGVLLASLYAGYSLLRCWLDPSLGPVLPPEERPETSPYYWLEHPCLESTFFLRLIGIFSCLFRSFSPGFPHGESAPLAAARSSIPCRVRRSRWRRNPAWPVWSPTSFRSPQPVGAGGGSTVHIRSLRSRTLARITSLRMMATSATLWCFPRAFSLSYRAFNSGLYVVAVKAAMYRTSRGRRRPPRICRGLADWPLSCA